MSKPPIGQAPGKAVEVEAMFDDIAPRYDLLNRLLSFGIDVWWRKRAVAFLRSAMPGQPTRLLDVATGTADLALELLETSPDKVIGADISQGMLDLGREKVSKKGLDDRIELVQADAADMPFEPDSFDGATVAFGVRNFENLREGLEGIGRVLRPGAPLVILETSQPTAFPMKQGYQFYAKQVMPRVGKLFGQNPAAYEYLPESAAQFPYGEAFLREMQAVGYTECIAKPLTFGVVSLYRGRAPGEPQKVEM